MECDVNEVLREYECLSGEFVAGVLNQSQEMNCAAIAEEQSIEVQAGLGGTATVLLMVSYAFPR